MFSQPLHSYEEKNNVHQITSLKKTARVIGDVNIGGSCDDNVDGVYV